MVFIREEEKKLFEQVLEAADNRYDEDVCMLRQWRGENGYHSCLVNQTVHSTEEALHYAYELMCRGRKQDFDRAKQILHKVIPLQDQNPSSKTYGLWSYFLEETLEEMAPPDWNWADFCGKQILHILLEYRERFEDELIEQMKAALEHACRSIIRRNVGPDYTNISIMGAYVTLAAGEYLNNQEFISYGKKRLETLHRFNIEKGAYQEYNSPSYTWVVITDLASMLANIQDEESHGMIEDLNYLAWRCLAEHYHYSTKQWAGPHSRFYAMLQDDTLLMRIQRALDYQIELVPLDKLGLADSLSIGFFSVKSCCPEELLPYFTQDTPESFQNTCFIHGKIPERDEIAVSYMSKDCTLGTFRRSTFWNQKRSHISYYDTPAGPVYCDLKCLHDFYDYSSGLLVTSQKKTLALTVFGFGTDGGDTHPNLDMVREGAIWAKDLRLRFEIGGAVEGIELEQEENDFWVKLPKQKIHIQVPYARFGTHDVDYCITEESSHVNETGGHKDIGRVKCIDIILYQGERKKIDFYELEQCCGAISFEIVRADEAVSEEAKISIEDGQLKIAQAGIAASAPVKACTFEEYWTQAKSE